MSKLLKFKDYISVDDAARHLTDMLREDVTRDDVLGLVLDGHLRASVVADSWACYYSQTKRSTIQDKNGREIEVEVFSTAVSEAPHEWLNGVYPLASADELRLLTLTEMDRQLLIEPSGIRVDTGDGQTALCFAIDWPIVREQVEVVQPAPGSPQRSMREVMLAQIMAIGEHLTKVPKGKLRTPEISLSDIVIRPRDLYLFAMDANELAVHENEGSTSLNEQHIEHTTKMASKWPWGDHETKLLRSMAAAAERFWSRYDPTDNTTAPTNQQVKNWLMEQGVADRNAEVIATILRADNLPTGPRK